MKKMLPWILVFGFTLAFSSASMATVIVVEAGDAGALPGTAQDAVVADELTQIFGNLSDPDPFENALDIDLYRIHIFDPLNFTAMTVDSPGSSVSDPQLFLFGEDGRGIYANDDDESGLNGSQSLLPAAHPFGPQSAGFYYLAIGWFNNEPLSLTGSIFEDLLGVAGPGLGGMDPILAWDSNVLQRIDLETAYEIVLTGVGPAAVPEPGALLLLGGLFGVFGRELRRRRNRGKRRS